MSLRSLTGLPVRLRGSDVDLPQPPGDVLVP